MPALIVVSKPKDWPRRLPGVEVVSAKSYLTDERYLQHKNLKVFNLCRSYRYQSNGYYVSLLAAARGHKPIPSISTLQDMRSAVVTKIIAEDLDELIQESLAGIHSKQFVLSIYFGKNVAKKYDRLSLKLFNMFQAPLLRATFAFEEKWELKHIVPIAASDIPDHHHDFVVVRASDYFGRRPSRPARRTYCYDLAILHEPEEASPPSNKRAIRRFMRAAETVGFYPELITRDDYGRLAEFDALFIRATTRVNHYTYRFARRAEAEGLVVVDDSESIIRCSNKVYLAEAMHRLKVPIPATLIIHRENVDLIKKQLAFPCVLKLPDSAFSKGVIKVPDETALMRETQAFFRKSDLIVAQEYIPTTFDWRVGVIGGKPLYACKYYMARHHWQIIRQSKAGRNLAGKVETLPVEQAPRNIIDLALRATSVIGNGFYGVDIKQSGEDIYLIEINDNPSVDAGYEDQILKDELYATVMKCFLDRIENQIQVAKKTEVEYAAQTL